jgi:hypothetical protein
MTVTDAGPAAWDLLEGQVPADEFEDMADRGAPLREVRAKAHESITGEELPGVWADFREQRCLRDGLLNTDAYGQPQIGWWQLYDAGDLGVAAEDRQNEAYLRKCSRADDARSVLQHGWRG